MLQGLHCGTQEVPRYPVPCVCSESACPAFFKAGARALQENMQQVSYRRNHTLSLGP